MPRWVGPEGSGVTVDVITVVDDGRARTVYRVRRFGRLVADVSTLDGLRQYVDPAELREEDRPGQ